MFVADPNNTCGKIFLGALRAAGDLVTWLSVLLCLDLAKDIERGAVLSPILQR